MAFTAATLKEDNNERQQGENFFYYPKKLVEIKQSEVLRKP